MGNPLFVSILLWLCVAAFPIQGAATNDWPTLRFVPVVTNRFENPTAIAHAGDGSGRLFVAERTGRIWPVRNGEVSLTPLLDLSGRIATNGPEQGLLGVAFPPNFAAKEYFYAFYTAIDNSVVVSRFYLTFNTNMAGLRTEEILLKLPKVESFHNGGQLAFGPDGYLYVGIGDGGPQLDPFNRAQDLQSLFGKILRIDTESGGRPYSIPPTNPFLGRSDARAEIWSYGLRNPWRFSFDRLTGDLFIGDVGQGRWEEIDFQAAQSRGGQNYGWKIMEGAATNDYYGPVAVTNLSSFTPPIYSYHHYILPADSAGSVTGGFVYRGPSEGRMDGVYFFGDFVVGWIWGLKKIDGTWESQLLYSSNWARINISAFGEDETGRLYFANYFDGMIYSIIDSRQAWAPEIPVNWSGTAPSARLPVSTKTPGAEIHYTLDGLTPTRTDPLVPSDGLVPVFENAELRALAFRADLKASEISTLIVHLQTGEPTFSPASGIVPTNKVTVSITSATPNATIYWSTNFLAPVTTNGTLYTGPFQFELNSEYSSIYAVAFATNMPPSQTTVAAYARPVTAPPIFDANGSTEIGVTNGQLVSISCRTPGAVIYYSFDAAATNNSAIYTGPIAVSPNRILYALADFPGYLPTSYSVRLNQAKTQMPVFSPDGWNAYSTTVTMTSATPGAVIHYTTNGTSPTAQSPTYTGPVAILTNETLVLAMATSPGLPNSEVRAAYFFLPRLEMPEIVTVPWIGDASYAVSFLYYPTNATLRFTLDGSEPTAQSPVYAAPIPITAPTQVKAGVFGPPAYPSSIRSAYLGITNQENTFVTRFAGGTSGNADGKGSLARFAWPAAIGVDSADNLFVADSVNNLIRKITPDGTVSTFAWSSFPTAICVDRQDFVYVADHNGCNRVLKISPAGEVSVHALLPDCSANFANLSIDSDGNLYGDFNHGIVRISTTGVSSVKTLPFAWFEPFFPVVASSTNLLVLARNSIWNEGTRERISGGFDGFSDGPVSAAGFVYLVAAADDRAGGILLIDRHRIRRLRNGRVTSVAGSSMYGGYRDGVGAVADFNGPGGLCVDSKGNIFVAETGSASIRKISPDTAAVGLPDNWQRAYFGRIGIDPAEDADGDGLRNIDEFWAQSDPTNAASRLQIKFSLNSTGNPQFQWQTAPGKTYLLQVSTDLLNWVQVGASVGGDGNLVTRLDATLPDKRARWFYRVILF